MLAGQASWSKVEIPISGNQKVKKLRSQNWNLHKKYFFIFVRVPFLCPKSYCPLGKKLTV